MAQATEAAIEIISGLQDEIDAKIPTSQKGAASGVAPLGVDGKIPSAYIPSLAIGDTFPNVASQAAMLLLNAQAGDIALRVDQNKTYTLLQEPASEITNWVALLTPDAPVQSVNGQTGNVSLAKSDIGLGSVTNDAQLKIASNLGDLNNATTARSNLGLGSMAVEAVGSYSLRTNLRRALLRTGQWYAPFSAYTQTTSGGITNGHLILTPMFVDETFSIDRIAMDIVVAGASGGTVRPCIYSSVSNYPNTLLKDFGTLAADSTGVKEATISHTFTPDTYWFGALVLVSSGSVNMRMLTGSGGVTGMSSSTLALQFMAESYDQSGLAALPTTFGAASGLNLGPKIAYRIAP
jgi:hypothetical protein